MRIETLATTSFETVAATFDLAFGDYAVSFSSSAAWLGEMMRRRGVRLELSVGARDEGSSELPGSRPPDIRRWHCRTQLVASRS